MGNENSHSNYDAKYKTEELAANKNSINDRQDCNNTKGEINDYGKSERISNNKGIASLKNSESLENIKNNSNSAIDLDGKRKTSNIDEDILSYIYEYDKKRADEKKKFYDKGNFEMMENVNEVNEADRNYIEAYVWKERSSLIEKINLDKDFYFNMSKKLKELNNVTLNMINKLNDT